MATGQDTTTVDAQSGNTWNAGVYAAIRASMEGDR